MHIAYLTPEYPHERTAHAGGMGTSIKNLVVALVRLGHKVRVFVYGQDEDLVFEDEGVTFHKIKYRNYKLGGFYSYRKHIEQYVNKNLIDVDIIEAPDWTGITAFMKLDKPLVIRFHGSDTYFCHIEGRSQKWKNRFFEKNAVVKANAYIAPTHYAGETSLKLFGLKKDKLKIIPYGLELDLFYNEDPTAYQQYNLLNIGTVIRKKGLFQLAQAFNKVVENYPAATLTLVGSDSPDVQTGSLSTWKLVEQTFTERARKQVTYLGKVPYNQVQELIKKAHVCVFPSLAETLGMVTIESMALHKAVVNTNIGWAQDLITHEKDGYMHHPDEIDKYVSSVSSLFDDEELVKNIALHARATVEQRFDIDKIAKENLSYYQHIIDRTHS
ncbi:glycosyltransferase family 4 protein [Nonlabens tegetincola]|uniref:glycosyltransferase family 4 protein n=1 Tax=Nonlabens tegetincola TaxID=323273 RepID=UPI000CF38B4E|nr:glycosyltransferase family 4 protein [Nonlabens tegetincola]PQJ14075.1 glycosyl transferase family 1 [Nonlabens tegetincola]